MIAIDSATVQQARGQDHMAWEAIVRAHTRHIYRICARFVRNREDLEDLAQEVYMRVFKSLDHFNETHGSLTSWITTIAKNLAIDYYRRNRRHDALFPELEAPDAVVAEAPSRSEPPEERLERNERARLLQRGLRLMSPSLRNILVMRELEGNSYQEIARRLHVPEGTVKSRLSRSRHQILQIFRSMEQEASQYKM